MFSGLEDRQREPDTNIHKKVQLIKKSGLVPDEEFP